MERDHKTREEISRPLYCPLLSIGEKTLQSCIEEDCAWWVEMNHVAEMGITCCCALLLIPWVIRK